MMEKSGRFARQRREPRKETYIPTKFRKIDADVHHDGRIKDISERGIRLDSESILKKGDRVEFIVDEPSHGHYPAIAEVKWVGEWTTHPDGNIGKGIRNYDLEKTERSDLWVLWCP